MVKFTLEEGEIQSVGCTVGSCSRILTYVNFQVPHYIRIQNSSSPKTPLCFPFVGIASHHQPPNNDLCSVTTVLFFLTVIETELYHTKPLRLAVFIQHNAFEIIQMVLCIMNFYLFLFYLFLFLNSIPLYGCNTVYLFTY